MWQRCHEIAEKSSKVVPLGAPLEPAFRSCFSSQLQLRFPSDSYGLYGHALVASRQTLRLGTKR